MASKSPYRKCSLDFLVNTEKSVFTGMSVMSREVLIFGK